jgi:hypothetical protein
MIRDRNGRFLIQLLADKAGHTFGSPTTPLGLCQ